MCISRREIEISLVRDRDLAPEIFEISRLVEELLTPANLLTSPLGRLMFRPLRGQLPDHHGDASRPHAVSVKYHEEVLRSSTVFCGFDRDRTPHPPRRSLTPLHQRTGSPLGWQLSSGHAPATCARPSASSKIGENPAHGEEEGHSTHGPRNAPHSPRRSTERRGTIGPFQSVHRTLDKPVT